MEKIKRIKDAVKNCGCDADLFIEETKGSGITVDNGKIENKEVSDSFGAAVRVFKNGKMGFGFFTDKSGKTAEEILKKAVRDACIEGYENYTLSDIREFENIEMSCSAYDDISIEEKEKTALKLEEAAKKYSKKIEFVRETSFEDKKTAVTYFNTKGTDIRYEKTLYSMQTMVISSGGKDRKAVDGFEGESCFENIDPERLGAETSERALRLLNAKSVPTGRYTLIIPPHIGVNLLELISGMFLYSNIRKGKSLLKDFKKGDKTASEKLTLKDNALLNYRAGSFPADGEGMPGQNKNVLENGVLNTFLYDRLNAGYAETQSTGNGIRRFKTLPEPGVSNFYIENGGSEKKEVMKNISGIVVDSLMGLHTADTVSGNFSLGLAGWQTEKGRITQAVEGVLAAGNIRDLLNNITHICGDLKFYY
ncbi:MAG: TldD/PmbA family protein, partial [bacterium]